MKTPAVCVAPAASLDAEPWQLGAGVQGRTSRLATGHLLLTKPIEMRTLYLSTLYLGTLRFGTIVADLVLAVIAAISTSRTPDEIAQHRPLTGRWRVPLPPRLTWIKAIV